MSAVVPARARSLQLPRSVSDRLGVGQVLGGRKRVALYRRLGRFSSRGFDSKIVIENMLMQARKRNLYSVPLLEGWLRQINNGQRFSDVIGPYIPSSEQLAIASGESSGDMTHGFDMAVYISQSNAKIVSAVKTGLSYPLFLLVMLAGLLAFIAYITPVMADMFPPEQWPPLSKALYHVSSAVRSFGILAALAAVCATIMAVLSLPRWVGPVRDSVEKILPPWSIYREVQGGLFLVTLAGIVNAGSPIDDALRRLRRIASPWLSAHLAKAVYAIAEGRRPSEALDTGLISEGLADDLQAYDRAGAMNESIVMLGQDCVQLVVEGVESICMKLRIAVMLAVAVGMVWTWGAFVMTFVAMRAANAI